MQMQATENMDKTALRQSFLAARRELDQARAKALSLRAQERVLGLDVWRQARQVMLYAAVRGETATGMLISSAFAAGKEVLLPRCRPEEKGVMDVAAISCLDDLRPGRFGIPEPDARACPSLLHCLPDLIVVPAVAFDRRGFRLGYGGGYYDRFLARLYETIEREQAEGRTPPELPPTIGLAYAMQLVERLPVDPWDHALTAIVTEEECLWTPRA